MSHRTHEDSGTHERAVVVLVIVVIVGSLVWSIFVGNSRGNRFELEDPDTASTVVVPGDLLIIMENDLPSQEAAAALVPGTYKVKWVKTPRDPDYVRLVSEDGTVVTMNHKTLSLAVEHSMLVVLTHENEMYPAAIERFGK